VTRDKNTWEQAKTAYAAGIGLRELARNMGIPEGTVLARAKREEWTQQIAAAKLIERPQLARDLAKPDAINAITPWQSAATTMQQRGRHHVERIADVTERVLPHLESMEPDAILKGIHEMEKYDKMARRNFGLSDSSGAGGALSVRVLTEGAAVEVSAAR
jgi:hypothetical protein